jgi:C4-dicarboxylate transporter, DctM subunit
VAALPRRATLWRFDELISSAALVVMTLIPLIEIVSRPFLGKGIENSAVLTQHLGLVLAMLGAVAAERHGHLTTLGSGVGSLANPPVQKALQAFANGSAALICGLLALASWRFVHSEMQAAHTLAYGLPVWWVQAALPLGFALLGVKLGLRCGPSGWLRYAAGWALPLAGFMLAAHFDGTALPLWPALVLLLAVLLAGAPIFAALGGLALALFWQDGLPLASIPLSHYQITVNPSLPALPLFTLAGLIFARTGAASRLGAVFVALFGGGVTGTVCAAAVLCSFFTAFTGGSGVTILALGGLLLPVALSYGIDPVHFGIIFLAAMEMGFLCPPAGMNIYFASAMFGKPVRYVALAVLPALFAIFLGTLVIAWLPVLATGLPALVLGTPK